MRRIGRTRTAPEEQVAALLRELGVRTRRNVRSLPGSPDFANKSKRFVVFVHGCFWHSHNGCPRATMPTANREFWRSKFGANIARDRRKASQLRRMGFRVLTLWECELEDGRARRRLRSFLERLAAE